jgi:hypothetical protein
MRVYRKVGLAAPESSALSEKNVAADSTPIAASPPGG